MEQAEAQAYLNRELSTLAYNRRVLSLALDRERPILERVKFVAISSELLDQFFQVRVAGLHAQARAGVAARSPDGLSPFEQLERIRDEVVDLVRVREDLFGKELLPALAQSGIELMSWERLLPAEREQLRETFESQLFPVLTPLTVDASHRFPHISNLSLNLGVLARDPESETHRFARVKVPPLLPRFLPLEPAGRFVPVEQIIAAHLEYLFPGVEIAAHYAFRLTLDSDIHVDEGGADDLLEAIESGLWRRHRINDPVRLEVERGMSAQVRELIQRELELDDRDVYACDGLLDHSALFALCALDRPDLKEAPWTPATQRRLSERGSSPQGRSMFEILRDGDILVQHPYDSFRSSVEALLNEAADDPDVLAIKQTLYRTGDQGNPINALARAARSGKEVVALVELQARFDESSNIEWARALEDAGVHVIYGVVGLKTHAKVALVVRREAGGIRRYFHLGTGNYNPVTANLYEDIGLLSASPELAADISELFNHLTGYSQPTAYRKLQVAPTMLREQLLALIRAEAEAPDGRIALKVNNLSDPEMIDALYRASQAGVEVDLIVRSICCLRPGVPELSERIRVRSIVGRFLEHSRICRFGAGDRTRYFIGSADWMGRNLDRRVEAMAEIDTPELKERLEEILRVDFADDVQAWQLGPDGTWTRIETENGRCAQERLQELARERAR